MKHLYRNSLAAALVLLSSPANGYELDQMLGTYNSSDSGFVHLKQMKIAKDKTGAVKISATLAGYPDDVYLGEAKAERYPHRDKNNQSQSLIVTLSDGRITDLMVITPYPGNAGVTSFLKYKDGKANEFFADNLTKVQETPAK